MPKKHKGRHHKKAALQSSLLQAAPKAAGQPIAALADIQPGLSAVAQDAKSIDKAEIPKKLQEVDALTEIFDSIQCPISLLSFIPAAGDAADEKNRSEGDAIAASDGHVYDRETILAIFNKAQKESGSVDPAIVQLQSPSARTVFPNFDLAQPLAFNDLIDRLVQLQRIIKQDEGTFDLLQRDKVAERRAAEKAICKILYIWAKKNYDFCCGRI